ncbi:metallophosphoesterase [Pseudomonas sp. 5Ae-yellow]|uniref:metallophosphoesterase n=1 Tax=Pseudomonas sp. 5Ae-yellow TaxID=2759848 RepID=UPI0015F76B04|nr:metallophosphoesterase [Pseudomonas sp. 5Ae-yellow]MBA6421736.1 metallophosphoesterase [Pseudomonas sp. 5Ae-yellow]|tara:strand:+ start:2871 stop:3800 length:930 start_codon:yes stop_codon:yes gene_type:complete
MYDLIGDIHGHASELKALLAKMGYQKMDGEWQHSERKVIFLGDFVDRGPEQVETVQIARSMVESGNALAVMGNHEFNAVCWATPAPKNRTGYLRAHTAKNRDQHQAFLDQIGEGGDLHKSTIEWFKTLPLFLDLPELRVIHACWHTEHLTTISRLTDDQNRLLPCAWEACSRKDSEAYEAIETLLKGLEIALPEGQYFLDKEKNKRTDVRAKWWQTENLTYRDLAMVPASEIEKIPHDPVETHILPGYDGAKPLFVGHYWLRGEPAPLNDHIACLDYSVAGDHGGKLCAYRSDLEQDIRIENFEWVEAV